ncbi:hypothetical protein P43SY_005363 [Pythium insidiosum]|uniref:Uncharacterized protein n=1 Tax=Pythium insidiosum TaxID=114742 RepID=A0AAD5LRA8_PYTIN|nr:hypothetical protein P43SY_005363 [Pythium insidiosum]
MAARPASAAVERSAVDDDRVGDGASVELYDEFFFPRVAVTSSLVLLDPSSGGSGESGGSDDAVLEFV